MVRHVLLSVVCFMLVACAYQQPTVNQLIIQNRSSLAVYDVSLKIPETGEVVTCSRILTDSECSLGFQPRALQGRLAILNWKQSGVQYSQPLRGNNIAEVSDRPLHAVVVILPGGELQVGLE